MKITYLNFILIIILFSCSPFPSPRNIDGKKIWKQYSLELKKIVGEILKEKPSKNFQLENRKFSASFDYPFDQGYSVSKKDSNLQITFYLDRGLLDHYSAIIFTDNEQELSNYNKKIKENGNDFKLEENWFLIND